MTKEEYEKVKGNLLFIIEEGESKQTGAAVSALLELETAWIRTRLTDELDADETEEEDYDDEEETDYGTGTGGDC